MGLKYLQPRISRRWTVDRQAPNSILLCSPTATITLHADDENLLVSLFDLLDGQHEEREIVVRLGDYDDARVMDLLEQMQEIGALEEGFVTDSKLSMEERQRYDDQIAFLSQFVVPGSAEFSGTAYAPETAGEYQCKLKDARVAVFGLGRLGAPVVRMLASCGVGSILGVDDHFVDADDARIDSGYAVSHLGRRRVDAMQTIVSSANPLVEFVPVDSHDISSAAANHALQQSTFAILCPDVYQPNQFLEFNQACIETGTSWTSTRLLGLELDFGPTIIPFKTPCYKCFELREKSNLTDYETHLIQEDTLNRLRVKPVSLAFVPGLSLLAVEIIKALTGFMQPATYAHSCSLNIATGELRRHPILKIPRCPHCGATAQGYPTIQAWQQADVE